MVQQNLPFGLTMVPIGSRAQDAAGVEMFRRVNALLPAKNRTADSGLVALIFAFAVLMMQFLFGD
jgi:hypothetical protein